MTLRDLIHLLDGLANQHGYETLVAIDDADTQLHLRVQEVKYDAVGKYVLIGGWYGSTDDETRENPAILGPAQRTDQNRT